MMPVMSEEETQARINRVLGQIFENVEANKRTLDAELFRLLGLMSVEFNMLERDFKYLLILIREDLPLSDARKFALNLNRFVDVLREVRERFNTKVSDPALVREFERIHREADALRNERNLMLQ